ncbi:MAG: P1 family peptidase [Lachnospiraceae bacterium]|nr:P1 family peptidase [Lachnospiraceae bacterium]
MRISDFGYTVGSMRTGPLDLISDVPGVRVGHCTVDSGDTHTGVSILFPCEGSAYERRPVAASFVENGYGKTAGLVQIDELGYLESPIALTNTLNVGRVMDALVGYILDEEASHGIEVRSVNAVVGETNDSRINRISARAVGEKELRAAAAQAMEGDGTFAQGAVGAGRGTVCFGLKGGIGSASRIVRFGGHSYCIGALVQSNFGSMENLMICGEPVGRRIAGELRAEKSDDRGSIMVIIGTDLPLDARQLRRVLKRAAVGLVRTGSFLGHGSGDVFIGFTNGNFVPAVKSEELLTVRCFPEDRMDRVFVPCAEAVEEAVLNSLVNAADDRELNGKVCRSLADFLVRK